MNILSEMLMIQSKKGYGRNAWSLIWMQKIIQRYENINFDDLLLDNVIEKHINL